MIVKIGRKVAISVYSAFGSIAMIRGEIPQGYEVHWNAEVGCEHKVCVKTSPKLASKLSLTPSCMQKLFTRSR